LRAAQVKNQLIVDRAEAAAAGKPFNPLAAAQRLVGDRRSQEDVKLQEENRERLRARLAAVGVQYSEDLTEEDLRRAGVGRNEIPRIVRLLKEVRGEK
jgi:hypothetical protein